MPSTIKDVLDRMHAINQTVTTITVNSLPVTVNAARYWPSSTAGRQPLIVPVWQGILRYERQPGSQRVHVTHQFANHYFIEEVTVGIVTQTAQEVLEQLQPAMEDAYLDRPQLALSGVDLPNTVLCWPGPVQPSLPEYESQIEALYEVTLRWNN